MRPSLWLWLGVLTLALSLSPAGACPVCDTDFGAQVRAGIFDDHFGRNVLWTLLPFPIFLLLAAAIYFGFPLPRPAHKPETKGERQRTKRRRPTGLKWR